MKITNSLLWNYDETRVIERTIAVTGDDWWFYFSLSRRGVTGHFRVFNHKFTWGLLLQERSIWFEHVSEDS